jgi:hypothetical protein
MKKFIENLSAQNLRKWLDKNESEIVMFLNISVDELDRMTLNDIKKSLKDYDVTITKDNIHLYYEFMSYEDFGKYKDILNDIFTLRYSKIYSHIKLKIDQLKIKTLFGSYHVSLTLFGVKDTLKPIDEYIAEIKSSSEYKEYICNVFSANPSLSTLQLLKNAGLFLYEMKNSKFEISKRPVFNHKKVHYVALHDKIDETMQPVGVGFYDKKS